MNVYTLLKSQREMLSQLNADRLRKYGELSENDVEASRTKFESSAKRYSQARERLCQIFSGHPLAEPFTNSDFWRNLTNPNSINCKNDAVRIGTWEKTIVPTIIEGGHGQIRIPALIPFIGHNNILLEDISEGNIISQNIALRVLAANDPQDIRLTLIDNAGLGRNIQLLSTLDEKIIGDQILYEKSDIQTALSTLGSIIGGITQKRLANKYSSLEEYNDAAGRNRVPYRLLLISNFPSGFDPESCHTLLSIMKNGPRAGVHTVLHADSDHELPHGVEMAAYRSHATVIHETTNPAGSTEFKDAGTVPLKVEGVIELADMDIVPDPPPSQEVLYQIISSLNSRVKKTQIPVVKYAELKQQAGWSKSTIYGIRVPVGEHGVGETLELELSDNTVHGMICGLTGSGKSVGGHTIINSIATTYSPMEVSLYLIDCKEGTELNRYRGLPHVKVLSAQSDKVYGVSVLEELIAQKEKRGVTFKEAQANDIQEYRLKTGNVMSRILLYIDEVQVLTSGTDRMAERARKLLTILAREGRSFGIHLILSTQTLSETNIGHSILSNIKLRIALNMDDSASCSFLGKDNPEAMDLEKGQAIFNDSLGKRSKNLRFRFAYLSDKEITENIERLRHCAMKMGFRHNPIVADGAKAGNIAGNRYFNSTPQSNNAHCPVYVGEPNYMSDDHMKFILRKQHCANALIVGSNREDAACIALSALHSIEMGSSTDSKIYCLDLLNIDDELKGFLEIPRKEDGPEWKIGGPRQVAEYIDKVHDELLQRLNDDSVKQTRILLSLFNLQNARDLQKEGIRPSPLLAKLHQILRDGPEYGIHLLLYLSSYTQLQNFFESRQLNEFETKIAVSGGDSQKLFSSYVGQSSTLSSGTGMILGNKNRYEIDLFKVYPYSDIRKVVRGHVNP